MSYPGKLIKGIVWQLWLRGGVVTFFVGLQSVLSFSANYKLHVRDGCWQITFQRSKEGLIPRWFGIGCT